MAEQLLAALKDAGILAYRMESGAGSYTNIVMGTSLSGYDIYVDESRIEDVEKILNRIVPDKNTRNDYEPEKNEGRISMQRLRRILAWIGIAIIVAGYVVSIL